MRDTKTYTQQEIASNIAVLTDKLESFILERKEVNKNILSVKNQIKYWEEMDEAQYKLF